MLSILIPFFFSSRRRHTRLTCDWGSDVCSSDLMERHPAGIDKKGFIQKDVAKGFPDWLERVEVPRRDEKEGGVVHYPLANDARALVWMANQNRSEERRVGKSGEVRGGRKAEREK